MSRHVEGGSVATISYYVQLIRVFFSFCVDSRGQIFVANQLLQLCMAHTVWSDLVFRPIWSVLVNLLPYVGQ